MIQLFLSTVLDPFWIPLVGSVIARNPTLSNSIECSFFVLREIAERRVPILIGGSAF